MDTVEIKSLDLESCWTGSAFNSQNEALTNIISKFDKVLADVAEFDVALLKMEEYKKICESITKLSNLINACDPTTSEGADAIARYQAEINKLEEQKKQLREEILAIISKFTEISIESSSLINFEITSNNNWTGDKLTARKGFNANGPQAYETWYDLDMNNVVNNMQKLYGYTDLEYKIRDDGVKILSGKTPNGEVFTDLVMVAADVRHDVANPNGTFERGQIVETSLGTAIVVDYCELAEDKRRDGRGVHFDIATAWWTEPYMSRAYGKEEI